MLGTISAWTRRRLSRFVRRAESLPLDRASRRVFDSSGGGQRFGRVIAHQVDFNNPARWSYQVELLNWNQQTGAWDFETSVFGVRNLNEWNNQAALGLNGNGTQTDTRGSFPNQISAWSGGNSFDFADYIFRLMPASTGTPIVPMVKVGGWWFFNLENGLAKLQMGCQ